MAVSAQTSICLACIAPKSGRTLWQGLRSLHAVNVVYTVSHTLQPSGLTRLAVTEYVPDEIILGRSPRPLLHPICSEGFLISSIDILAKASQQESGKQTLTFAWLQEIAIVVLPSNRLAFAEASPCETFSSNISSGLCAQPAM